MIVSAGVLAYRRPADGVQVLLGHLGGPFWARKQEHAWSIPKGEVERGEDEFTAARREFTEELGHPAPVAGYLALGRLAASGKQLVIWAVEHDLDPDSVRSNTFTLEWPPRSGRLVEFPEFDRAAWFGLSAARAALVKGQLPYLDRLVEALSRPAG